MLKRAAEHKGTSFVEVYQNCNVFNDGAFEYATDRETKADTTLELEHGKPLIFGKNRDKGIRLNGMRSGSGRTGQRHQRRRSAVPRREVRRAEFGVSADPDASRIRIPEPIGVFRCVDRPRYEERVNSQIEAGGTAAGRS